jgi:hypothetical protein
MRDRRKDQHERPPSCVRSVQDAKQVEAINPDADNPGTREPHRVISRIYPLSTAGQEALSGDVA